MKSPPRFLIVLSLMAATALFLHSRTRPEQLPPRLPLESFPRQVGGWSGRDVTIGDDVLQVLGAGDFLLRIYQRPEDRSIVDLFLAFFPSQRTGDTIHSPKNCLPGAGWEPVDSARFEMKGANGRPMVVNRYVIAKGLDRQVVIYWYQAHGRAVANEYLAKFYLAADAIRTNRTDGALVRVITPLERSEDLHAAETRALDFVKGILPTLGRYVPD